MINVLMVLALGMTPAFLSVYFERKFLLKGGSLDAARFSFDDLMLAVWMTVILVLSITFLVLSTDLVTLDGLFGLVCMTVASMTVVEDPKFKRLTERLLPLKQRSG